MGSRGEWRIRIFYIDKALLGKRMSWLPIKKLDSTWKFHVWSLTIRDMKLIFSDLLCDKLMQSVIAHSSGVSAHVKCCSGTHETVAHGWSPRKVNLIRLVTTGKTDRLHWLYHSFWELVGVTLFILNSFSIQLASLTVQFTIQCCSDMMKQNTGERKVTRSEIRNLSFKNFGNLDLPYSYRVGLPWLAVLCYKNAQVMISSNSHIVD